MDFHSMTRKDLQRLCKKHGIQANLKNAEMADRLSSLFKEENPTKRGRSCLKSGEEEVVSSNESKKVKFSLENETFWFEKTDPREMRLMARKNRGFQNSKIEQNPVSIVEEVVQNDGCLGNPLERKLRRGSVLVKCDQISELQSVEKPITLEKKARRGSVAVKCDQRLESKSVDDHVGQPVRRSLRRKSLAVKADEISEPKAIDDDDDFGKPVSRNTRRKSVVVEPDHILEAKLNDEKVEKPAQRRRGKSVVVESDDISVSKMNDEKVEKPAQRTRGKSAVVESDHMFVSKMNDAMVEKPVQRTRRKAIVVKADHISESKMNDEKVVKPVQRTRGMSVVVEVDHILESKRNDAKVEEPAQRTRGKSVAVKSGPSLDLETVVEKVEKPIQRAPRRKCTLDSKHVIYRVEKPATRASRRKSVAVKSDQNLYSKTDEVEREPRRSFVESDEYVNSNIAVENSSDIAPDIKKGKRGRAMKITRKQGVKRGRKTVDEDIMEDNVGDETIIIDKTHDDAVTDVQTLSNVSSMLQSCGDGKAESSTQANKVDECSSLNIVADKSSYLEDAPTPPSLLRMQFSDPLVGSTTQHNVVAGEHMWQSTTRPSLLGSCAVGDAGGEQPSGSLSEMKSARRDRETFESSDGFECHQTRNEQWLQQESFDKSPCLEQDERINCAAGIVEEADVKTIEQDEHTQLFGSSESIVREVDQTYEVSVDQQPSHFTSGEKVVLSPEADMEANVHTPVIGGVIHSPNASDSTQNKVMEEDKEMYTSTQLWNQDIVSRSSDAEDSPVVLSLHNDDSVAESLKSKASECVSVSGKTKYLEQSSVDAAEDLNCTATCSNSNPNVGNFEDQGTPGVTHPVNRLLHLDAVNTYIEPPMHNDPPEENITAADKLDNCLKDDDNIAELKLIPQEDIIHQSETPCDYRAQSCELTVVSDSVVEGRQKGTPRTDFTCFSNDENGKLIDENAKYITAEQLEQVNCVDELEFQHMVSGVDEDDITNDAQSGDLEFKRVTWTTEDLLALGGEVDESVMSQERKPADLESERNTLHISKDFELKTVNDAAAAKTYGEDSVIILHVQDGKLAETSNVENATLSGGCIRSSNAVSENSLRKETINPLCEFGVHFKDNETSADPKSNSCNTHATAKVLNAQYSRPDASLEKSNLKIEIDHIAAQETKFVDSIEDKVKNGAHETGYVEEAEGVGTRGDGSLESTIGDMLDYAPELGLSQQAKSMGSVKKESLYISQQAEYVEGTTEVVNSAEIESSKSNGKILVGEESEMELAVQNILLATVSEISKRDGGDEKIVTTGLEGNHFGSCGSPFFLADKSGSPMRNSGNFSLRKVASGSDNDAGSLMVDYPTSMDTMSTCSADVYAPTCKIASESLQTSQVNICNETLLNACIGDVDGLHSGEPIPFKDNQENIAEVVESEARASNATLPESAVLDDISVALVSEIPDGPGCIFEHDSFEYANTREMELHGLTSSPLSTGNRKVKGNYEANIAEPRDNVLSDMVESHPFGGSEKGDSDIEGALNYAPEKLIGNHLNAASRTTQENVNEEQDACTDVNDHLAVSWPADLLCDISEISHAKSNIVHEKVHSKSELVLTANHGNCISEDQVNNQEHMDFIHTDTTVIEKGHSAMIGRGSLEISPKHIAHSETRSSDVTALSSSMEEDGKPEEHFYRPSERRIGRESSDIDTSDNIAETDFSPPSLCRPTQPGKFITAFLANESLKSSAVLTDSEIDYLFCGDWETEKVEVRELQSDSSNVACSVNEYEIPVGTHQPADEMILEPENLASGDQELGNSESEARYSNEVLKSSVIQQKNIKNNGAFDDLNSNIIFTDSEIDLLWGEAAKDQVRELQTEASDDTCPVAVSEYGSVTDMVQTHQPAFQKNLEPKNLATEGYNPLGDDEEEKSDIGVDPVPDVQNCIDDKVIQRRNERSILIHGTPKKLPIFMNDMKENTPAPKRQQMVDVTAVKPSLRRKALQKID